MGSLVALKASSRTALGGCQTKLGQGLAARSPRVATLRLQAQLVCCNEFPVAVRVCGKAAPRILAGATHAFIAQRARQKVPRIEILGGSGEECPA